jgi:hypothetical protein
LAAGGGSETNALFLGANLIAPSGASSSLEINDVQLN